MLEEDVEVVMRHRLGAFVVGTTGARAKMRLRHCRQIEAVDMIRSAERTSISVLNGEGEVAKLHGLAGYPNL